jgi:hypothetical protein
MMHRLNRSISTLAFTVLIASVGALAYGQGANTSSLSGTVVDTSGGVIPGASVNVKNDATGVEFNTVTDEKGIFLLPAVPPGSYTLTTTLMGFKKQLHPGLVLNVGVQGTLKVVLEVGGLEEVVTVTGGTEIIQTQSTTISQTINSNQIENLPLVSRDAINALTMLPGVDTASSNRNSTVSGLPRGAVSITIDGVNTQDNNNKTTEGFFSLISPRLDAVEEVTMSSATSGADSNGTGAVQIKFITRSGTNRFQGSAYYYERNPKWNSNYWFNNRDKPADAITGKSAKDQVFLYEPGIRLGGPIQRDRAFFFFNVEEFRQPNEVTRQRTILTPDAMAGIFLYTVSGATRQVNLLQLGAANGQTATLDPTVAKVMADIRSAVQTTGGLTNRSDPNEQLYTFSNSAKGLRYYPTVRLDYNLSQTNRLTGTYNRQVYHSTPDTLNSSDPSFPGFPIQGSQNSVRVNWTTAVRSTLSPNVVNEVHGGYTNSFVTFFPEITADAFTNASTGNTGPYFLSFSGSSGNLGNTLTNASNGRNAQGRENPTITVEDNLTWLRGAHSISFGGTFTHVGLHSYTQNVVPQITFGIPTGDPALAMFSTANFPGASTTQINAARDLYATLTGHVSTITSQGVFDEATGKYVFLGSLVNRGQQHEFGFFAQDQWRALENVTFNFGLRWEVQQPFVPRNNAYSTAPFDSIFGVSGPNNLFMPGTLTGSKPQFVQYNQNTPAFDTDWNNFAPSVGVAWRPEKKGGWLGALLGSEGDTVVRAAYGLAYNRNGIGDFSGVFSQNPGATLNTNRTTALGTLGPLPLLFRNTGALGPQPFSDTPSYPLTPQITDELDLFDPNIKTPYTHSMSIGVQRELSRNLAFEVRYVGTRNRTQWVTNNFNENNIKENGFIDEFRKAQANLQANIAAGRGSTFAYFGPGTGTAPLPIYLGYFNGQPASQAGNAGMYTGANWSSTNFTNPLAIYQPLPLTPAGTNANTGLDGDPARRANALAAGLPVNLFRVNPDLQGGAMVTRSTGFGKYDALQIELRKRLSAGFQLGGNYTLANAYSSALYSLRAPRELTLSTGATGGIHHALKLNWVYELPFGEGKRFAHSSGLLNHIVGGWGFDGNARIQTGQILSFGNVRLVGMTDKELKDVFTIRKDDANRIVYILPQDIIDNTIKAYSTSATSPTGYGSLGAPAGRYFAPPNGPDCIQVVPGDCAPREHFVTGPKFVRFDLSASKRIAFAKRVNFEFRADFLNAFNNINFLPVNALTTNTGGALATMGQVTSAYTDANNTQDPGGRLVQLGFRINW